MTDIDRGRLIISHDPTGLQLLGKTVSLWLRRLRERAELARLDDRERHDIGATQADVEAELSKPFWRG